MSAGTGDGAFSPQTAWDGIVTAAAGGGNLDTDTDLKWTWKLHGTHFQSKPAFIGLKWPLFSNI